MSSGVKSVDLGGMDDRYTISTSLKMLLYSTLSPMKIVNDNLHLLGKIT
jgi:hypothetical protein